MTCKSIISSSLLVLLVASGAWATTTTTSTSTTSTLPIGPSCNQMNQFLCRTGGTIVGPLAIQSFLPVVFEGSAGSGSTTVSVGNPANTNTLTVPDADSTTVQPNTCAAGTGVTGISATGVVNCGTSDGLTCAGCVGTSDIGVLSGANPLVFDGATPDANHTTVAVTDPTGARTFTIPNAASTAVVPTTCGAGESVTAVNSLGLPICNAVSSSAWSALAAPGANLSLSMNNNLTTFTWGNATGANPMMLLTESVNNTGSGAILKLKGATGSASHEFEIENAAGDSRILGDSGDLRPGGFGLIAATRLHSDSTDAVLTLANGLNDPITLTIGGTAIYSFYKIQGPTGAFSIGGTAETPEHGSILVLYNKSGQNMTIKHNSTGGAAEFFFMNAADHTTTGDGTMTFIYEAGLSRWIEIAEQL